MISAPFVLLDDARDGGAGARLYTDPVEIVVAETREAVRTWAASLDNLDGLDTVSVDREAKSVTLVAD